MAPAPDKIIKLLENRVKILELEVKNNQLKHKQLQIELKTAIAGILKSIGKKESEIYLEFRKEMQTKIDAERKKWDADVEKRIIYHKPTAKELRVLLR